MSCGVSRNAPAHFHRLPRVLLHLRPQKVRCGPATYAPALHCILSSQFIVSQGEDPQGITSAAPAGDQSQAQAAPSQRQQAERVIDKAGAVGLIHTNHFCTSFCIACLCNLLAPNSTYRVGMSCFPQYNHKHI